MRNRLCAKLSVALLALLLVVPMARAQFPDAISREFSVFNSLFDPTAPLFTDAISREFSVFNAIADARGFPDAVSREFSLFNAIAADASITDAISREFSLFNGSGGETTISDAISREFSVYNDPSVITDRADAISREFSLFNGPTNNELTFTDAVSREFSLFNAPLPENPLFSDAISREFTVNNGPLTDTQPPTTEIKAGPGEGKCASVFPIRIDWTGTDDVTPTELLQYAFRMDNGAWSTWSTATSTSINALNDGEHTFEVKARDLEGKEDPTPAVLHFRVDTRPLLITSVAANPSFKTCAVTWTTDRAATSQVEYGLTTAYGSSTALVTALVLAHNVTLTGLTPGKTYHYRVHSTDDCGNTATSSDRAFTTLPDVQEPNTTIDRGPANDKTVCAANVEFCFSGTDDLTTAENLRFRWRLDNGPWQGPIAERCVTLTGLANGSHTFEVAAIDEAGNVDSLPADRHFVVDVTPLAFSAVAAAPDRTTAVVTWTTSRAATSQVEYGTTTAYGSTSPLDTVIVTSHRVNLTGLTADTSYHFRVRSRDECGNTFVSDDATFRTLPEGPPTPDTTPPDTAIGPEPGEGAALCDRNVVFTFTGTDDRTPATLLKYLWRLDNGPWQGPIAQTSVTLSNLSDGAHRFEVAAIDEAGNTDPTPAVRNVVVDTGPLTISNLRATGVGAAGATIQWNTNRPASSQVEYRKATESAWQSTALNAAGTTDHSVPLAGLAPSTSYVYRAISQDACGQRLVSNEQTLSTGSDSTPPDTFFTSGPADNGKACATTAEFCWTATDDVTPTAQMQFSYKLDENAWSAWDANPCHTFSGLAEGLHTLQVRAQDEAGHIDPTPAVRNFFVDLTPPTLSNLVVDVRDYKATISWNTSEPANAQVEYGTTSSYGQSTPPDTRLDGAHRIVISGLTPRTTYHFRVRSSDGCREVVSADQTFTTTEILRPNLVASELTFPSQVTALQSVAVSWRVQNQGQGDASGPWNDVLYFSTDATLDAGDTPLGTFSANSGLTELASYRQTLTVAMPARPAGNYYLIVATDTGNAVLETNEADNVAVVPIEFLKASPLIAAPDQIPITLNPTVPVQGQLDIGNLSTEPLTGIAVTIENAPPNVQFQIQTPSRLESFEVKKVDYKLLATDESVLTGAPVLHFTSAEGEQARVTLNLTVIPRRPQLVLSPTLLEAGMTRNQQKTVECRITNTGSVAAQGLKVLVPAAPWLTLVTAPDLGDLPPGETATITLSLHPDASIPLGPYTGNLAVNGANTSVQIPFRFNCVSDGKGDLRIVAEDEYSYFAFPKEFVAGAKVVLKDALTGAVAVEGETNEEGVFEQKAIPEGYYNVEVTAEKHGTAKLVIEVVAGQMKEVRPFLPRQFVTYTWNVEPEEVVDHYKVDLVVVFETHVPAPVVTRVLAK